MNPSGDEQARRTAQAVTLKIGDVFNPFKMFAGIFIPEPICKYKGLSPGAKMAYGRLCRYAGENGTVLSGYSDAG